MITYQCIISGKVQGVYYRASIQEMASEAGFDTYNSLTIYDKT
jgi:acylphosphatase